MNSNRRPPMPVHRRHAAGDDLTPPPEADSATAWQRFGARVRTAREKRGWELRELAGRCGVRQPELVEIEVGDVAATRSQAASLDSGLEGRGVLLDAWARIHITDLVEAGADLRAATHGAHRVCGYAPLMVPEMFQTYDYARAADACLPAKRYTGCPFTVSLDHPSSTQYALLLDETVLHRNLGGVKVMRGQLKRLLEYTEVANVSVHVIPARAERHPGLRGGLWSLTFSAHHTIAFVPTPHGPGQIVTDASAIQGYADVLAALQLAALPGPESADLLRTAVADIDGSGPKALPRAAETPGAFDSQLVTVTR